MKTKPNDSKQVSDNFLSCFFVNNGIEYQSFETIQK